MALIELSSVSKHYAEHLALADVTLSIEAGELVYLIGPSGAGKTTLLKLLTRELRADSGSVMVGGRKLGSLTTGKIPELRRAVASVPQDHQLLGNRSIADNVQFALGVLGWRTRAAEARTREVLDLVGLGHLSGRLPGQVSTGERQRVAIARAIAGGPQVLLADEPTGNLDPLATASIAELLDGVAQLGCAVVMATHDAGVVDARRSRVIALKSGRVVSDAVTSYGEVAHFGPMA